MDQEEFCFKFGIKLKLTIIRLTKILLEIHCQILFHYLESWKNLTPAEIIGALHFSFNWFIF